MAAPRRQLAFVDTTGTVPEKDFRAQVEDALQRLARLIAANTTADGALANRVTELEDAPPGYTAENARDDIGAALVAGTNIAITVNDGADTITIDNTAGSGAPVAAQYLTLATHASLTVERVFVPSTGLSAVDGGANGSYTLSCTITQYTDEMARDALGAALVAGHGCDITVNDGADTITVDVDETEFATAPGLITPAMLNNGSAGSVLGVTGGSAGARADIAPVAHGILHNDGSTTAFRTFDALILSDSVLYEVDFTTLANNALSGAETLDGHNWTVSNEGNSTLFEIVNGIGLHWDASTTNTAYNSATQTASRMQISWTGLLGSAYDPQGEYVVEIRFGARTMAVNGNTAGIWIITSGTGATNNAGVAKLRTGGVLGIRQDGPASSSGAAESGDFDVISLHVTTNKVAGYYGTWAGGWPAQNDLSTLGYGGIAIGNAQRASYLGQGGQTAALVLAASTGETGGTMDVVVRQLRVRRIR